jgi:hypothetical protein
MRSGRDGLNHYYQVVTPFAVEVLVGHRRSNVSIGTSNVLASIYETITVRPGDELHCLLGGDFLVRKGEAFEFFTRRHEASDVLMHPAQTDPALPLAALREIPASAARKPAKYHHELPIDARRAIPK